MNDTPSNTVPPASPPPPAPRKTSWWKWLLGALAAAGLLVVLAGLVFALSVDAIVRGIAQKSIAESTGMKTELAKLELHFRKPGLRVEGFRLMNPPEFGGGAFLDLPELEVKLDRKALSERRLHFEFVRANIAELNIAVSGAGRTNYMEVQKRGEQRRAAERSGKARPQKPPMEFAGLDRLELSFGTLRYTDLRDPDHNRSARFGLTNVVVSEAKTKEELGAKLLIAVAAAGVDVLDLLTGGLDNLPQKGN